MTIIRLVSALAVVLASAHFDNAMAQVLRPCLNTPPKVITLELQSANKIKDPGDLPISGGLVNIVWIAPPGPWVFRNGDIDIPGADAASQFNQRHIGNGPVAPPVSLSKHYHVCDQNTAGGRFPYHITVRDMHSPNTTIIHDPAIVNDGTGLSKKRRVNRN